MFANEADKDYVIEVLIEWVAPLERPRETLTAAFIGTTFPQDLTQGTPRQLVMDAVRLCLVDAWNHDPPWLVLLLNSLGLAAVDSQIAKILTEVRTPPPPSPSPLDSTILNSGTPFVDRLPLRRHLRRLASTAATAQPIFVVSGNAGSGKSYSSNYIEHFSYNQPPIVTYRIALNAELGLGMGAAQVASDLVTMMGRPLKDIQPDTNLKLYVRRLALWVLGEAAQTQSQHWFVLDNFRGENLRADTRELLIALSAEITNGVFPQRCRLILIGFDRALLTVDPGKVEEETIGPCPNGDVEAAVGEILKRAPVTIPLADVSPLIIAGIPPNGANRMKEIDLSLRALIRAVAEVQQILAAVPDANYGEVLLRMIENLPAGDERTKELNRRLEELRSSVAEL